MSTPARRGGFTLIEMLATIVVMSIVLTAAISFYLDLSNMAQRSTDRGRVARRATILIDRIARDFEQAALMVKPSDMDPLEHPWIFLAERGREEGSDRIKFISMGNRADGRDDSESDLEQVAWQVDSAPDGTLALVRWSEPRLPEELDLDFPSIDESTLMAEGLASFGVRMLDEEGEWVDEWDSSTLVRSSQLPLAVEISLAFEISRNSETLEDPAPRVRRVVLPLRPLDLEELLFEDDPAADSDTQDDEEDEDRDDDALAGEDEGVTVAECLAKHPEIARVLDPGLLEALRSLPGPASDHESRLPPEYTLPQDCR